MGGFALFIPPIGHFSQPYIKRTISPYLGLAGLLTALAATFLFSRPVGAAPSPILGAIVLDSMTVFFTIVFLLVGLIVNITSLEYMRGDKNQDAYYSLLLLATLGMVLISSSVDLIVLYAAWELMNVSTYTLTCIRKGDPLSNEAAVKLFILSALSSAVILYGVSILFGITGSTNVFTIAQVIKQKQLLFQPFTLVAIVLFVAGFGFKMAVVPFHMWIPDVYEGAPTTIGAFLAAATKGAGFAAAIRVFAVAIIALRLDWNLALAFLALLTMTWGNIAALMQKNFIRLLAYSSIAHAGYILIGVAIPTQVGISGALFHVLNHAIMKSTAFIGAMAVTYKLATSSLDGFNGLGRRMPIVSFNLAIALLALAGVPPLNGFISKLVLFTAAIDGGMTWLAVAGVLNSAFSLGYYGWIIKRMYFDDASEEGRLPEPFAYTSALAITTTLTFLIGIYPEPVLRFTNALVLSR